MQQKVQRPVPLVFIMVFTVITSLTYMFGSIGPVFKGAPNYLTLLLGLLYLFMGIGGVAAVVGLWMLIPWANLLTRIIYIISIPIGILAMLLDSRSSNVVVQLFNIGLDVWIVWYLMRAQTKALFKNSA
ncbi:MAG: hypothetical protein PVJ84_05585 [Desulfobacteraceae bacterium]|jgi:hypothetical protein